MKVLISLGGDYCSNGMNKVVDKFQNVFQSSQIVNALFKQTRSCSAEFLLCEDKDLKLIACVKGKGVNSKMVMDTTS